MSPTRCCRSRRCDPAGVAVLIADAPLLHTGPITSAGLTFPDDYPEVLGELEQGVRDAQIRDHRLVNIELIELHWAIGATMLDRQATHGRGAKVIDRLSEDLRAEFPQMTGLSRSNLHYMRHLAATWSQAQICPRWSVPCERAPARSTAAAPGGPSRAAAVG